MCVWCALEWLGHRGKKFNEYNVISNEFDNERSDTSENIKE